MHSVATALPSFALIVGRTPVADPNSLIEKMITLY